MPRQRLFVHAVNALELGGGTPHHHHPSLLASVVQTPQVTYLAGAISLLVNKLPRVSKALCSWSLLGTCTMSTQGKPSRDWSQHAPRAQNADSRNTLGVVRAQPVHLVSVVRTAAQHHSALVAHVPRRQRWHSAGQFTHAAPGCRVGPLPYCPPSPHTHTHTTTTATTTTTTTHAILCHALVWCAAGACGAWHHAHVPMCGRAWLAGMVVLHTAKQRCVGVALTEVIVTASIIKRLHLAGHVRPRVLQRRCVAETTHAHTPLPFAVSFFSAGQAKVWRPQVVAACVAGTTAGDIRQHAPPSLLPTLPCTSTLSSPKRETNAERVGPRAPAANTATREVPTDQEAGGGGGGGGGGA